MSKDKLEWGQIQVEGDKISPQDIVEAERSGSLPPGKYLCRCESSTPARRDYDKYSCYSANLKWIVEEVKEIEGQEPSPEEAAALENRFIFDSVNLSHPEEKAVWRRRRILIAKRTGMISDTSQEIPVDMWTHEIIGKRAILTLKLETWKDKEGKDKSRMAVAFDGYDYAHGEPTEEKGEAYDDI